MKNTPFQNKSGDDYDFRYIGMDEDLSKILTILVLLEDEHPGLLKYILRIASLVVDNWRFSSTVSDPERSLSAQKVFDKWLQDL